ncbi:hypothetical protein AAMO2058_000139400 [Amorphochlora amoebiformis]
MSSSGHRASSTRRNATGAESKERTLHFSDKVQIDRLQKLQQDLKRSEEVLRKLRGILVGKLEKLERREHPEHGGKR